MESYLPISRLNQSGKVSFHRQGKSDTIIFLAKQQPVDN